MLKKDYELFCLWSGLMTAVLLLIRPDGSEGAICISSLGLERESIG